MNTFRALIAAAPMVMMAMLPGGVALADITPQQTRAVFDEAQQAYDRGIAALAVDPLQARQEFSQAAQRFQLLADQGRSSGALLYNLANAYLQAGDLGRAILNYRRAQRLLPADDRIQNNLQHARSICRSQIEPSGQSNLAQSLLGWHYRTPLAWRFAGFAATNALLWVALSWWVVRPSPAVRALAALLAFAWLTLGSSVGANLAGVADREEGVLIADDVIVRKGNGIGFQPSFDQPLHAGVEFHVLERRGNWLRIRLADGQDGWILDEDTATID